MKIRLVEVVLGLVLAGVVASSFAQTWVRTSAPTNTTWAVATSADGKIICAVNSGTAIPVIVSKTSGDTWSTNAFLNSLHNVGYVGGLACSVDGRVLLAVLGTSWGSGAGHVYVSTNAGDGWTLTSIPTCTAVACSGDGRVMLAGVNSSPFIFVSTNFGINWKTNSSSNSWRALAVSPDGTKFFGLITSSAGGIYVSTNFGVGWILTGASSKSWTSISSSINGDCLAAAADATYLSYDAGLTWASNQVSGNVHLSPDGRRVVVFSNSKVYISSDSGVNWVTNIPPSSMSDGMISADGCRLTASTSSPNGGIWVLQSTPAPELRLLMGDTNTILCWVPPTTNFVLQENSDLLTANWTTVSNPPSWNYTNIQYEVSLPTSELNHFFRLIAH